MNAITIKQTQTRIRIKARICFRGDTALKIDGEDAKTLIKDELTRQFSYENPYFRDWQGSDFDFPERKGQRIKLTFEIEETKKKPCVSFHLFDFSAVSCMLFFPQWRPEKNKHILMFTRDRRAKRALTSREFGMVACHEFGHAMGVNDLYRAFIKYALKTQQAAPVNPETPANDIMRTCYRSDWFTPNDIEMAVYAAAERCPQTHEALRLYRGLNRVSKAVRYGSKS